MRPIVRVALEYGPQVASLMASATTIVRNLADLGQHAHGIAQQHQAVGGGVEYGQAPAAFHPQYAYLCWEWDSRFQVWRVAHWNGAMWVLL
jgi:hypothetical protein